MFYRRDWLIFFVVLTLVFLAAGRTAVDPDTFWHLRAGEQTVSQGYPLLVDLFSVTHYGDNWTNHSWLGEVAYFLSYQAGEFAGMSFLVALLASLSMGLLFFQMSGKPIFRAFLIVLGMLVAAAIWSPRPQMFSLLLLSILGLILYLYKWKRKDYLWGLPVLFILWSNLHGGYPLGLMLLAVTIAGESLNKWTRSNFAPGYSWREIGRLALISLLCGLAVVINPNGFKMWLIPFQTVGMDTSMQFITEWWSPNFHELFQQPFLWLFLLLLASFALSGKRADAADLLSVVVFSFMGFSSRRYMGPFAIIATPILSRYLWLAWKSVKSPGSDATTDLVAELPGRFVPGRLKVLNLVIVGLLFFCGLAKLIYVNSPAVIASTLQQSYPAAAADWIKQNLPAGDMLNEYNWGGYLSWALPGQRIFIDGRADLYGDTGINEWINIVQAGESWHDPIDKYQIDFAVLEPQRPLVAELLMNNWRQVFKDASSVVLVRPAQP